MLRTKEEIETVNLQCHGRPGDGNSSNRPGLGLGVLRTVVPTDVWLGERSRLPTILLLLLLDLPGPFSHQEHYLPQSHVALLLSSFRLHPEMSLLKGHCPGQLTPVALYLTLLDMLISKPCAYSALLLAYWPPSSEDSSD